MEVAKVQLSEFTPDAIAQAALFKVKINNSWVEHVVADTSRKAMEVALERWYQLDESEEVYLVGVEWVTEIIFITVSPELDKRTSTSQ